MNARTALLLIALPLALAGCGNKGPLVLPPKPVEVDPSTMPPEGAETTPVPTGETEAMPPTDEEDAGDDVPPQDTPPKDVPPTDTPAGEGNG